MKRILTTGTHIQRKSNVWHGQLRGETSDVPLDHANIFGCIAGLTGIHHGIVGDASNIYGDASNITGNVSGIYGDVTHLTGDVSRLFGCVSEISGNCTGVVGDATGLAGNLDEADLSETDRDHTIGLNSLITMEKEL